MINNEAFYKNKMDWLSSQVDVEFPTPESIKGRDVYLSQSLTEQLTFTPDAGLISDTVTVLQVTEHRLTIRWAMTVASQWENTYDDVLEFLTQVDVSDEYQLFVALDGMKPVAACISQIIDGTMYVSDVVVNGDSINENGFISAVMEQQSSLSGSKFTSCVKL
ncbi:MULTISPECIES: hypothetical protein [Aliivibrio]|jgi:hypothetical protein|uniref:Flavodoxin n=3 Tax=Aliivibrio TaxID=511678 RepID=A0A1B9NTY7_ALILO|nr:MULTISPECIES: hypothetical protein [Aliivibrio]AZL86708.1 hypothetical protein EIJ81_20490 [Aliivibrio salmonicida]MBB1315077.1 hypothetical protein [Aliivibrio sp. SR45-2]OCH17172.1 hypothetical protein A6E04_20175 [Aliivibrio logei]OEF11146.1 hypothetical protein A1Q5_11940 [Aliivibrio logei 5S-186]CAQ81344.1 hypothetical protein VSAL_II0590 [Aliivibrio salmonicida LFI1238]